MIEKAEEIVNEVFDTTIRTKRRRNTEVLARMAYYSLLHGQGFPLDKIGKSIGRSHASVLNGLNNIDILKNYSKDFAEKLETCHKMYGYYVDEIIPKIKETKYDEIKASINMLKEEIKKLSLQLKHIEDGTRT